METNKPSWNLATEYFMFKHIDEDVIILWQNDPCVVLGCNQNAYKELNLEYIKENNIEVVRRISGGGAVFHDLGNVNFTFITKNTNTQSMETFTKPVVDILNKLGVNAQVSGRNDIVIKEHKISGNAQFVQGDKILHHGTLMYDVSCNNLTRCLNVNKQKLVSKGISSVQSRVTNISSHLEQNLSVNEFVQFLQNEFIESNSKLKHLHLNENHKDLITKYHDEKFANENWIFGTNYDFEIENTKYFNNVGLIQIHINVSDKLEIKDIAIQGDFFAKRNIEEFIQKLINSKFTYEDVKVTLENISNFNDYFLNLKKSDFLELLF